MAERKKFIDVEIPLLNKDVRVLGTPKDLDKKTIKLDLTRKLRGKGVVITFQIFNNEEKLVAIPKRAEIIKSYLKKIIRKRTDNVEDSFDVHFLDVKAKIKPFLITRKKVSRVVRKNLRNTAREFLIDYTKAMNYNDFCYEILDGTIQKNMLPKLKKVYPLAFCDIRVIETKDLDKIDLKSILLNNKEVNEGHESDEDIEEEIYEEKQIGEEDEENNLEEDSDNTKEDSELKIKTKKVKEESKENEEKSGEEKKKNKKVKKKSEENIEKEGSEEKIKDDDMKKDKKEIEQNNDKEAEKKENEKLEKKNKEVKKKSEDIEENLIEEEDAIKE